MENLRELGRQRRRRHAAIALPPPQSVFAATEAGADYYSRRTSLAKKVLRLSFAWQNSAFEVRSSDSSPLTVVTTHRVS